MGNTHAEAAESSITTAQGCHASTYYSGSRIRETLAFFVTAVEVLRSRMVRSTLACRNTKRPVTILWSGQVRTGGNTKRWWRPHGLVFKGYTLSNQTWVLHPSLLCLAHIGRPDITFLSPGAEPLEHLTKMCSYVTKGNTTIDMSSGFAGLKSVMRTQRPSSEHEIGTLDWIVGRGGKRRCTFQMYHYMKEVTLQNPDQQRDPGPPLTLLQ